LIGEAPDRIQVIVVFLAILELVKQKLIETDQPDLFGDISLSPNESLFAASEDELILADEL
jgi:chromatin segregation and condensation protein Rec8/ScpA/Scc1 (kleisin family)